MTTRGEIGFLIAALAQSSGLLEPQDLYLVVLWGVVLCTLLGPICVGLLVRRMENIEEQGRAHVLGDWGSVDEADGY